MKKLLNVLAVLAISLFLFSACSDPTLEDLQVTELEDVQANGGTDGSGVGHNPPPGD